MTTVQGLIETKLASGFPDGRVEVINESSQHNVPPGSESHFRVTVISQQFDGQRLIGRHRQVNSVLAEELAGPVHALALHTYTAQEWVARGNAAPDSPDCFGGSGK